MFFNHFCGNAVTVIKTNLELTKYHLPNKNTLHCWKNFINLKNDNMKDVTLVYILRYTKIIKNFSFYNFFKLIQYLDLNLFYFTKILRKRWLHKVN